ncbi:unnamed protein product [Peronospora farinosa]|uniref:Uncharacterized protein n=1 Tax=Peronospora farinosa TaxID=134698 RepID=A0ABN8CAG8_9STRA|nr:unnamed protein product [Peronospora farinosa]
MQKLISSRSCIRMIRVFITVLVLVVPATSHESAASTNSTPLNVTDYWIEDHPYVFQPYWKRLRNGKIVLENDSTFSSVRDTVRTNTSWISRWVLSSEGQRTLRKDLSRLLMYNLVSPMDYGDSLRSSNVRRRRNKAVRMFLTDNLALPALKTFGRVAWNLIQSHYVDYFKDEMFTQRLKTMNASEMIREFNLTLPIEAIEEIPDEDSRPNTTQAYEYDGEKKRAQLYRQYSAAFDPYENYSNQFYTRDDTLPPPTFPADSYPWLWSSRLNMTRMIVSQLLQSLAVQNVNIAELDTSSSGSSDDAILSSCPSSCAENDRISRELANVSDELLLSALNLSVPANGSVSTGAVNHGGNTTMSTKDTQAFKQIQVRLEEFYFDTGIPRLPVHPNVTNLVFPSLATFLRVSLTTDASTNHSAASEDSVANNSFGDSNDAVIPRSLSLEDLISDDAGNIGSMTDFSSRSGVYAALTHYYAFPSADKWMIKKFDDENISDCTLKQVCLVHSGVTVYTPSLTALKLAETFNDMSVAPTTKRLMRLMALLEMVQVAFEAERRALKHGLQGPSTVWYSTHDLDVDEFADAVLGTINMSISGDTGDSTPLHVFEKHMNERVPILDEEVSYYAETNHDTKFSMELNHSIPMLDKFQESDLVKLVSSFTNEMKNLNRAIGFYVETRSTDLLYQEVVSATTRGDLYNGSEYTLIGFGFLIPATNKHNVLYRDMKLPVPFHLVVRLLVRFQESRLLLPQESRQVLVCLTMAYYNISFYRCHNSSSTNH